MGQNYSHGASSKYPGPPSRGLGVFSIRVNPRASCLQIMPTLGLNVYKWGLFWATWSPRGSLLTVAQLLSAARSFSISGHGSARGGPELCLRELLAVH